MLPSSKIGESSEPSETFRLKHSNSFALHGIAASVLLTFAYFSIVSIAESVDHALTQFVSLAYLFIPLIVGFGIQIALFSYSRQLLKTLRQRSMGVTTSGGISTVSMIACCLHHLTDVVALIGLTAVALFLATYQAVFILIGIVSNIVGVLTILIFIQKNRLYHSNGFLARLMRLNMTKMRKLTVIFGVAIVIAAFAWVAMSNQSATTPDVNGSSALPLPAKTASQNGLTIQATPQPFNDGNEVKIDLSFDTHGGSLSFDLTKMAKLEDSKGTVYEPVDWSGSAPGGHHMSGTLTFPPLSGNPSSMNLVLTNVYGADWAFEWNLS